jgi:hypothetical protein
MSSKSNKVMRHERKHHYDAPTASHSCPYLAPAADPALGPEVAANGELVAANGGLNEPIPASDAPTEGAGLPPPHLSDPVSRS